MLRQFIFTLIALASLLQVSAQSVYNHLEAFAPQFYPYPGNEFRSAGGSPGPKYWQNHAGYKIACTLDTVSKTVTGRSEMTYTNNSPDNLKFLWLQMDQNIYRQDSRASATTTASGGRWANTKFTEGFVIKSIEVEVGGKKYVPEYLVNDTRMQVMLQNVLKAAGGKLRLIVEYSFSIPEYGTDRMGRMNTKNGWLYEIAQWYPRACVYDDLQGWNVLPYLGQGEFYLEYGDLEYSITAPRGMIIVGSGELLNPSECLTPTELQRYNRAKGSDATVMIRTVDEVNAGPAKGGRLTWKFRIRDARDAAWAASKAFVLDGARINLPGGKKSLALSAYPVESIANNGWQRSTEMVKGSIEFYSKNYYPYPYPVATNVGGPVGGMEYPGIVFCHYSSTGPGLWGVTDHELGHTWFPMIVGSNERKFAWMDEGFNTFINSMATPAFNKGEFNRKNPVGDSILARYMFSDYSDVLNTIPEVMQQRNLGNAAYGKPSIMLHALRELVLGPKRFDEAFNEYIRRWAFKHPSPWDFFRTMENVGGEDLDWFWRGWVFNNWRIDQGVKDVKPRNSNPDHGTLITLENLEKMPMPATVVVRESNGKEHRYQLPVEIWQRGAQYMFEVPTTSEVTEVTVDPDKKLPDWNRANNTWRKKP